MQANQNEQRRGDAATLYEQIPKMDVGIIQSRAIEDGVNPAQICRTCDKTESDRVIVTLKEMITLRKANGGVLPPDALCQPSDSSRRSRITQERVIEGIRALRSNQAVEIAGKTLVQLQTTAQRAETGGYIDGCGQQVQEKCKSCTRFRRVEMRIQGGIGKNGKPYFIDALVGGHCSIPVEGIVVSGNTLTCDRIPTPKSLMSEKGTCADCAWNSSYGEASMLDHVTPLRGGLTSYEREMVVRDADPERIGQAMNEASRARGKVGVKAGPHTKSVVSSWAGMLRFFKLEVALIHEEDDRQVSVDLRMPGTGDVYNFSLSEGDDSVGLISLLDTRTAILEITSPHQHKYGLSDTENMSYPGSPELKVCPTCNGAKKNPVFVSGEWKDINCERCGSSGTVGEDIAPAEVVVSDFSDLVDPSCTQCWGNKPCYHHLRAPYDHEDRGVIRLLNGVIEAVHVSEVSYARTDTRMIAISEPVERIVTLSRTGDTVRAVDGDGNDPKFGLFRMRMPSLMNACKNANERAQLMKQFNHTIRGVSNTRRVDFSWSMPAPVPAFHPFCAVNLYDKEHGHPTHTDRYRDEVWSTARGIDFAEMWNDAFGTPRDRQSTNPIMASFGQREILPDPQFSWTKWQERKEWERAHGPGEAEQDEFLASQNQLRQGRRGMKGHPFPGMDENAVTIDLGVGIPNTSILLTSTSEAMDWLNAEIVMPGNDEAKGFKTTRRWAALGYENFRNTKRLMEDDIPSVFEFNHHESIVDEGDAESKVGFYACTRCYDPTDDERAGHYIPHEVSTLDLTCPNPECDGVLFFMPSDEYRQGYMRATNYAIMPDEATRRMSGSADSASWQQTARLRSMSCPNWAPRKWN